MQALVSLVAAVKGVAVIGSDANDGHEAVRHATIPLSGLVPAHNQLPAVSDVRSYKGA
jgi:hypothetical protein